MLQAASPLSAVLLGMGLLLLGNGLFGTLTALRMTHEGFDPATIGIVIACHSIGFAAACLTSGRIIDAVGHIRTFAAFAATVNGTLAGFIAYRMTRRAPVPEDLQQEFVAMPQTSQTTPVVGTFDPRTEEDGGDQRQALS